MKAVFLASLSAPLIIVLAWVVSHRRPEFEISLVWELAAGVGVPAVTIAIYSISEWSKCWLKAPSEMWDEQHAELQTLKQKPELDIVFKPNRGGKHQFDSQLLYRVTVINKSPIDVNGIRVLIDNISPRSKETQRLEDVPLHKKHGSRETPENCIFNLVAKGSQDVDVVQAHEPNPKKFTIEREQIRARQVVFPARGGTETGRALKFFVDTSVPAGAYVISLRVEAPGCDIVRKHFKAYVNEAGEFCLEETTTPPTHDTEADPHE